MVNEKVVIGSLIDDYRRYYTVNDVLKAEMFTDSICRKSYEAIEDLIADDKPVDLISVSRKVGNGAEVAEVSTHISEDYFKYALVVVEDHMRRSAVKLANDIIRDQNKDAFDILQNFNEGMAEIEQIFVRGRIRSAAQVITDIHETKEQKDYYPTGSNLLNKVLAGWTKSDLTIIAGRPSMGKTAFALSEVYAAASSGVSVGFFSLEMGERQLMNRLRALESGLSGFKIAKGLLNEEQKRKLYEADLRLKELPIYIDDNASTSIYQLRNQAFKMVRSQGVKMIFVDYLQLMKAGDRYRGDKTREVGEISRGLKILAKELDIPVIALSQLSRAVDSRNDKRPLLSDLRESGDIEQDADNVIFCYRPEYYKDEDPQQFPEWDLVNINPSGLAVLSIAKHRNGPLSNIPMNFDKSTTRFSDYNSQNTQFPLSNSSFTDDRDDVPF